MISSQKNQQNSFSPCQETSQPTAVIGIGSPHGDDRAGWEVIDRLADETFDGSPTIPFLRRASVPHDVLDWLQNESLTHLVDAGSSGDRRIHRFEISLNQSGRLCSRTSASEVLPQLDLALAKLRSGSSHQFDLLSALQLAATLGRLPRQVVLWMVPVVTVERNAAMNEKTLDLVAECAARIQQELRHA